MEAGKLIGAALGGALITVMAFTTYSNFYPSAATVQGTLGNDTSEENRISSEDGENQSASSRPSDDQASSKNDSYLDEKPGLQQEIADLKKEDDNILAPQANVSNTG